MHPRSDVPPDLLALSRKQRGAVSHAQVAASGLSRSALRRLIDDGQWRRVLHGVYVTHSAPLSPLTQAHAGLLSAGSEAWLFGGGALALHLGRTPTLPLHIAHPDVVRRAAPPWLRFVRRPTHDDIATRRGAQCSAPAMALVEAASHLSRSDLVSMTDSALSTWVVTPDEVRARVGQKTRHRRLLTGLLDAAEGGRFTELERIFGHDVIRAHKLPAPTYQYPIPGTTHVADAAYDEFQMLLELDGRLGHDGLGAIRDRRRDNTHAIVGWLTLRFGWHDAVGSACAIAVDIADALTSSGWTGSLAPCRSCATTY